MDKWTYLKDVVYGGGKPNLPPPATWVCGDKTTTHVEVAQLAADMEKNDLNGAYAWKYFATQLEAASRVYRTLGVTEVIRDPAGNYWHINKD